MYRSSAHQQIDFETLYRLYWPRIVRFCATCLAACPDGTAEEVAQDVFLAAHRALAEPRYRGATLALHSTVGFGLSALGGWAVGAAIDAAGGAASDTGWTAAFMTMSAGILLGPLALWWSRR